MTKCRKVISYNIKIDQNNEKKHENTLKTKIKGRSRKSSSSFFTLSQIVAAAVFCWLFAFASHHLSPVNCKLTRKTYTVWDLSPEEFENLLEQEKALQIRKRNLDYFLRRRAKKTKELLPSLSEEYEGRKSSSFATEEDPSKLNNLGK